MKMTTMLFTLSTICGLILTASALQCYEATTFQCGDHDAIYDEVCDTFDSAAQPSQQVTCPDKCAIVSVTNSYQGMFQLHTTVATCSSGSNGCMDKDELEAQNPELNQQIMDSEAMGITVESVEACICGENLCNSAMNLAFDGSRCYESSSFVCGSHDSTYDAVCNVFAEGNQPQSEVSCPGKCGLVTASYSYQGYFDVDFTLATCSAGADGCLDEAQLAAQNPELEEQIKALEAGGLSVNDVYACTCSGDLCNSALNIATNPVVVFFSMMVVILQAFFFS
ncbi:uncharacterized protein [Apostichopus japonicus]|uniref:uncharacterized protein isoform X2 n=1 Tax=Stichopus japonicus TaxID=307972 RepID=UPI003AB328A1